MSEQSGVIPILLDDTLHEDLESVYQENAVAVYRRIFTRVGNAPDAEDLTEEVFMIALRWLRLPCARPQVRAYLGATIRSVLAEHWRRHYGLETTPIGDDQELSAWNQPGGGLAAVDRVRKILNQLPRAYRTVLELRFLRGYSAPEMARELGISSGGVRMLQFRALRAAALVDAGEEAQI